MRTADVFHAPAVPYNTPIRGRLSTPFTVLFSETRNTLPAQIFTDIFAYYNVIYICVFFIRVVVLDFISRRDAEAQRLKPR